MRFFTTTVCAFAAFVGAALGAASTENPIIKPDATEALVAGSTFEITWVPTTAGPITLLLRQGPPTDLKTLFTITSDLANSGSFSWTVPSDLTSGSDYAIQITDGPNDNYTPQFAISGTAAASSSVVVSSSAAASSAAASSTVASSTVASSSAVVSSKAPSSSKPATSKPTTLSTIAGTGSPTAAPSYNGGNGTSHGNGTIATARPSPTIVLGNNAISNAANVVGVIVAAAVAMVALN